MELKGTGEGYGKEKLFLRMSHGERTKVAIDPALNIEPKMSDWRADLLMPDLDALAKSIRGGEETGHPTLEDGLAVQAVIDSIHLRN